MHTVNVYVDVLLCQMIVLYILLGVHTPMYSIPLLLRLKIALNKWDRLVAN